MKRFLAILIFVGLSILVYSNFAYATQTYKIKVNLNNDEPGYRKITVPRGTPTTPSKAANPKKLLNANNTGSDKDTVTQTDTKNSSVKKVSSKKTSKSKSKSKNNVNYRKRKTSTVNNYNWVNNVGEKLLESNDIRQDITFSIINKNQVNAYTNVYNEIKVYSGILRYLETDDELAALLGHEMGHVLNRDVRKGALISGLGKISRAGASNSAIAVVPVVFGSALAESKLSRNMEYAADIAGIDMMVNAGYNPLGMLSLHAKITENYVDLLATHPTSKKRMLAIYNYIEKYYPQYINDGYPTAAYKSAIRVLNK